MSHIFPPPPILKSIFTFISILIAFPGSDGDDEMFEVCQRAKTCGRLQDIKYPFWSNNIRPKYCGRPGFELICEDNQFPILEIGNQRFRVLAINDTHPIMRIARDDYFEREKCPVSFPETSITNQNLFNYSEKVRNLSFFFDCSAALSSSDKNIFRCPSEARRDGFYTIDGDSLLKNITNSCSKSIKVPIILNSTDLLGGGWKYVLNRGFEVVYNADNTYCSDCSSSKGICRSNPSTNGFLCFCRGQPNMTSACPAPAPAPATATATATPAASGKDANVMLKTGIGLGAAFGGMAIMAAAFFFYLRRKKNKHSSSALFSRNTSSDPFSKSDLEQGDNYLGVHVFSYSELEEATNYFDSAKELGDGGFGTVYFGKLQDGRAVAVKRLYENNYKRVEQFMNEVEILAHLRHQNLVSLYGCTSRHSRELLLVYEYIPNGTVADHLHGERTKPGALPWPTRLKIAIETASALTYLHASDIIHRDVKTNNILLDENFCVKVADFGLSRLFPTHVTHVSTAPQGTPGYVDPEYHQCYRLTDKSDVFSFGVVLIELISSMPAVDITRHRHEINLSNLAINKIQNKALHELVDPSLEYESDSKVKKTINAVAELAFQCLQSEKELRPSMVELLEILKDIERDGYNTKRTEEMLKQSPDSVTHNWTSTETTPTSSS